METITPFIQYGALGVLVLVLFGGWKIVNVLVLRVAAAFDTQATHLEKITVLLSTSEVRAAERHGTVMRQFSYRNGKDLGAEAEEGQH
jgi:hypothetical protein